MCKVEGEKPPWEGMENPLSAKDWGTLYMALLHSGATAAEDPHPNMQRWQDACLTLAEKICRLRGTDPDTVNNALAKEVQKRQPHEWFSTQVLEPDAST